MRVEGVVLAGGCSRRFGTDKAAARFGAMTMLDIAASRLAEVDEVTGRVVVSIGELQRPWLGYPTVGDRIRGIGPLGGIEATLASASAETDALLYLTCDMPLVSAATLSQMIASLGSHDAAAWTSASGREMQFPLLLRRRTLSELRALLSTPRPDGRGYSIRSFLERIDTLRLTARPDQEDEFANINTPAALAEAINKNL